MCKSNLLFLGIEIQENESESDLENAVVTNVLEHKLNNADFPIKRIHHIGRFVPGKNRSVIIKL